jgi:hypothetical protein
MSMAVSGGFSPYDVIAFVQEHAEKYASMVKSEMQSAEDRSQLVREIADLSATLEDCKNRGDWAKGKQALEAFMEKHPETWGGGSMDMVQAVWDLDAWSRGQSIVPSSYAQTNYEGATTWGSSFHATWSESGGVDTPSAQSNVEGWVQRLNDWKDKVSGDDKIGMMTLQSDADQMKNLYEVGSNLVSKSDQIVSTIIGNIGRG